MTRMLTLITLALAWPTAGEAQEPDRAETWGVYPAPEPDTARRADTATAPVEAAPTPGGDGGSRPADATRADTAAPSDTSAPAAAPANASRADTAGADTTSADTTVVRDRSEIEAGDTSLTVRMDAWRGGGLRREELPDLLESARIARGYTEFLDLIGESEVALALSDSGPVTLLAPTDAAFARLPEAELDRLRRDSAALAVWAAGLMLDGDRRVADLLEAGEATTRAGTTIRFARQLGGGMPLADDARIVQPDLAARNGTLHGVDLVPPISAAP